MSEDLLKQILTEITGIKTEIGDMKTDIGGIKTEMQLMKEQISENTQLLKSLEHRTEENTAQLNHISETVNYLHKDNVIIKEELLRHGDLLEVLAVRSTKQEADIYRLKHLNKIS